MVATPTIEKVKFEKKPKVIAQWVLTKPSNPIVAKLKAKGKSLKRTTNSTLLPSLWNSRTH